MQIILAEAAGMCFGVRDALEIVASIAEPTQVTIHGELVHNPTVTAGLAARGFHMRSEAQRQQTGTGGPASATPQVLITAHGVGDRTRTELAAAGHTLIDTTCPLVRRAHAAALQLRSEGRFVIVLGRRGHVEVVGLVEDLEAFAVIERLEDVRDFGAPRLGVLCQTTTPPSEAAVLLAAIREHNSQASVRVIDTICQPTKDRQEALENLLDRVQAVVIVGGRHSNNTRALVARARERQVPAWHVEGPGELRGSWFAGLQSVGLTAGTSTLPETLAAVHAKLLRLSVAELPRAV
jgi:4-hydroxy-3-methylbut-2-enyl diphosphate reductase